MDENNLPYRKKIYYLLSAIAGAMWGGLAFCIGQLWWDPVLWGGVVFSPFIGLLIGYGSRTLRREDYLRNAFFSLASLYVSVIFFGVACGLYDLFGRLYLNRDPGEVVFQAVLVVLAGTTAYILLLWPLSAITHLTICSLSAKR